MKKFTSSIWLTLMCCGLTFCGGKNENSQLNNDKSSPLDLIRPDFSIETKDSADKIDIAVAKDAFDPGSIENPILALAITNQLQTAFAYLPNSPFQLKKVVATEKLGTTLTELSMIANGNITKDIKNNLALKTGLADGSIEVSYSTEQHSYDVTLFFEDNHGNLYPYMITMDVNDKTHLEIRGAINVDILKILPASIQHILTAMFDEVFNLNGSSENVLTWSKKVPHTMLPIVDGEITKFQIDLIDNVLLPLCKSVIRKNNLNGAEACARPNLSTTPLREALDAKIQKRNELFPDSEYSEATVEEIFNSNASKTNDNALDDVQMPVNMTRVLSCEQFAKDSGFWSTKYIYYVYISDPTLIITPGRSYPNRYLYRSTKAGRWLKDKNVDYVGSASREKCRDNDYCHTFSVEVESHKKQYFQTECNNVNNDAGLMGISTAYSSAGFN